MLTRKRRRLVAEARCFGLPEDVFCAMLELLDFGDYRALARVDRATRSFLRVTTKLRLLDLRYVRHTRRNRQIQIPCHLQAPFNLFHFVPSKLTRLVMKSSQFSRLDPKWVASTKSLRSLELHSNWKSRARVPVLPTVTHLTIVDDNTVDGSVLACVPAVTHLQILRCENLKSLSALTSGRLRSFALSRRSFQVSLSPLKFHPQLVKVDLSFTALWDDEVVYLSGLRYLTQLKWLSLRCQTVVTDCRRVFFESIPNSVRHLRTSYLFWLLDAAKYPLRTDLRLRQVDVLGGSYWTKVDEDVIRCKLVVLGQGHVPHDILWEE